MTIVLDGSSGITTPDVTSSGSLNINASAPDDSLVVDASGNVGIGTSSPLNALHAYHPTQNEVIRVESGDVNANIAFQDNTTVTPPTIGANGDVLRFVTNNAERARIDSSGNVGIGTTSPAYKLEVVGSIYVNGDSRVKSIYPIVDNVYDVGTASFRFDDIYATNGTIQTSDANEKQDIEALSEAEARVAVACKGLLRKFRWKDSVAEKGDEARIHFGIIAQDLQAAFAAEGLDAGRYAMFISSTWWEAERVVPAVEEVLDDEGNVVTEAVAEHTVTDTYATAEEAPEGATERTRLGVRYPELLAFIIGAI